MSNSERKANLPAIINTVEPTFTELARRHGVPDFTFAREAGFAVQILRQNDYLAEVACGNPDSLKEAIVNVAAVGLSLSPVHKQAYLVPRKQRVCLDISYQGLIDLATSRGAILWAKSEIVYENDEFSHVGVNREPRHTFNPFGKRGDIVGGYCIAKMPTGDLLVDFMPIHEIYRIRDRSEGWKAYVNQKAKSSPWASDEGEMIKKTLTKRGYKSWPKSIARGAMEAALDVTNEADGIDFKAEAILPPAPTAHREENFAKIRDYLEDLERDESAFIEHLCKTTNRKILKLDDLTDLEITQAVTFLKGVIQARLAKLEKHKGATNEDAD